MSSADINVTEEATRFTRKVIDSLRIFVGVCSTDGILLQANESALAAAGIAAADVLNKPFREAHWWAHLPDSQRMLDTAIERAAAGTESRFDVEITLVDKKRATIDFQIVPMRGPDGSITHLIPSAIDVTDRRQTELALELAEQRSRALLREIEDIYDSAPIGLCVLDTQLRFKRINKRLAETNGMSVDAHLGKGVAELLPDIAKQAVPLLQQVLDTGEPIHDLPLSGTTPAQPGVKRDWIESWIPMRDDQGTIVGINMVAEEVTERRRSEDTLRAMTQQAEQARQQAEQASRSKSEFLANMSHEIRTPMTAILGYTDLLESHLTDPDDLQSVRTIKRNGKFLIGLIDDILDLSKIESGKLDLAVCAVSPIDVIEQTLDLMRLQADRKQLDLRVAYEGKLPVSIDTDPRRLRQILINLTGNAVKFTETGSVTLRAEYRSEPQPCVLFHVTDTGIGMTLEQQSEVFEAFRQADSSISRRFGGSGLGLSISQRLADSLGGSLFVESKSGGGSTFTLQLPAGSVQDMQLVTPVRPLADAIAKPMRSLALPYRLLAVDDRRDVLHVVQHILEDAGAEVITASRAADALHKVAHEQELGTPFDAIVLDMQMPEINGYQAAKTLRERGFHAPIIALTANAMKGEREKCLAAGCTDYLTKPIDSLLLLQSLVHHIGISAGADSGDAATASHRPADETHDAENGRHSSQATPTGHCILLVEDHEESARVLSRLLERSGHEVHSALNAAEAVLILQSIVPTVVLSDIGLPDEDGYKLATRMRAIPALADCVFVALTGTDELDQSQSKVFDHHMTKPVDIERMRNFLANQGR